MFVNGFVGTTSLQHAHMDVANVKISNWFVIVAMNKGCCSEAAVLTHQLLVYENSFCHCFQSCFHVLHVGVCGLKS